MKNLRFEWAQDNKLTFEPAFYDIVSAFLGVAPGDMSIDGLKQAEGGVAVTFLVYPMDSAHADHIRARALAVEAEVRARLPDFSLASPLRMRFDRAGPCARASVRCL